MKKINTITSAAVLLAFTILTACVGQKPASTPETSAQATTAAQTTAAETTVSETTVTTTETAAAETSAEAETSGTASVKDIASVWFEDALDPRTLTINEDGTFTLEYKGGGAKYGTVKIDYEEFGDGTKRPWYHLYEDDDTVWLSFAGDMDGEQLLDIWGIPTDEDEVHFRRDIAIRDEGIDDPDPNEYGYYPIYSSHGSNISVENLEGMWRCDSEDEYLSVYECGIYTGSFVITYSDSTIEEGTISLEYCLNPDDSKEIWYNFYTYDGKYLLGFVAGEDVPINDLYAWQSGEPHFVREGTYSAESVDNYDPFYEYIGQWKSEEQWNGSDFYIKISEDHGSIITEVTAHSAAADYQWTYICAGSDDGTYIECTGNGTLIRTDYAPNGDIQEPETVYTDGTAKFNIKGGTLFWEDCKEGTARQVGFSKGE